MLRSLSYLLIVWSLSGCELIPMPMTHQPVEVAQTECVFISVTDALSPSWQMDGNAAECRLSYWLDTWASASSTPWQERKLIIGQLGQSPENELYKYMLSQPVDTPYQVRLRAQSIFNKIKPFMQEEAFALFEKVTFLPSQQLLEYQSTIAILSQTNARQVKRNEEQAQLLLEQEEKINRLLNLEASILEKNLER